MANPKAKGPGNGLTPRQEAFVAEYLVDLNGTQAAIRAGYSEKTADVQAHRLLGYAKIAAAIIAGKDRRSERTGITADWLLSRLADEAEADIADLYYPDGGLRPVHEWPVIWRKGLVAGLDVESITSDGAEIGTIHKIRLSDRIKRLELIGKHINVQAFQESVKHSGSIDVSPRDNQQAVLAALARKHDPE